MFSLLKFQHIVIFFGFLGLAGCNALKRPSAHANQQISFAHVGITGNCASCHDTGKSFAAFPATGHVLTNGQDCGACHTTRGWTSGVFSHTPTPAECASCHGAGGPQAAEPSQLVNEMLHTHAGLPDCVSCHASTAGTTWSGGIFSHSPTPSSCQDCHGAQRPVGSVGNPPFDHANGGMGDCVSCHTANVGQTWSNASFSHSPTPSSCASCHVSQTPTTIVSEMSHQHSGLPDCVGCHTGVPANIGVSWNGGTYNHSPSPTSCQDCHGAQRPVGPVGSPVPFDHANGGMGDCVGCHRNPGVTWSNASFSHSPVPTSCANCHASEMPAPSTAVGAQLPNNTGRGRYVFYHETNFGTECFACHTVDTANIGVSWTYGYFDHTGNGLSKTSDCSGCHFPHPDQNNPSVNDSTVCGSCHTITWPTPNSQGNYAGQFGGT